MRIAVLSPVAWRTPPKHYGPWEQVAYNIAEGLLLKGHDVTLFATKDSIFPGKLEAIIKQGYEEDKTLDAKVAECLHISHLMEMAGDFDIIHNNFDFLPLTYSRLIKTPMLTTIHGFSSEKIIPVYKQYNDIAYYVSISYADRHPSLNYFANIYHGIRVEQFDVVEKPQDYLLFFGRMHPDKGAHDAVTIAKKSKRKLIMAGIIQDAAYFEKEIKPAIDDEQIVFIGQANAEKRNELLSNAAALLHPIYFNEPFGLSVAEAMCCGTPVIAYNRGSMPELIKNNASGFLVCNVEEAVEAVNKISSINRNACSEYAREKFSLSKMIEQYEEVYKKILSL